MKTLGIYNGLLINFHKPPVSRKKLKEEEPQMEPMTLGVSQKG
jgi:hypothetical protein